MSHSFGPQGEIVRKPDLSTIVRAGFLPDLATVQAATLALNSEPGDPVVRVDRDGERRSSSISLRGPFAWRRRYGVRVVYLISLPAVAPQSGERGERGERGGGGEGLMVDAYADGSAAASRFASGATMRGLIENQAKRSLAGVPVFNHP